MPWRLVNWPKKISIEGKMVLFKTAETAWSKADGLGGSVIQLAWVERGCMEHSPKEIAPTSKRPKGFRKSTGTNER